MGAAMSSLASTTTIRTTATSIGAAESTTAAPETTDGGNIQQTPMTRLDALSTSANLTSDSTHNVHNSNGFQLLHIFNYKSNEFVEYAYSRHTKCEDVCLDICRELNISPLTRLLFALRVYDAPADRNEWAVLGQPLKPGVRYAFRMRFKVPDLHNLLQSLDAQAFEYLYRQMRADMVREYIPEIRYPVKKDYVMGLGVVDMYVDLEEHCDSEKNIKANYQRYLPQQLVKKHWVFCQKQIRRSFPKLIEQHFSLQYVKEQYVLGVHKLAPNYLMETYTAVVDSLQNNEQNLITSSGGANEVHVLVKLESYDSPEPGLKVARLTATDNLEWILVTKLDNVYAVLTEEPQCVRLEITGLPHGYRMRFDSKTELESFITYLAGYVRLTSKWMLDLCERFMTPSLKELKELRCHGPVGGSFSFAKIRQKRNQAGSYIVRQCEKEYDTYYIDINTKVDSHTMKCKTETFKIRRHAENSNSQWVLHFNDEMLEFEDLTELAQNIPTSGYAKFRIPPSEYDKPQMLLICLPKNLQPKKHETEISEVELQRKRVQIIHPTLDLQWYKDSQRECDDGKMIKMRADWIQQGNFKDVMVTLKWLKCDTDYPEFQKLINNWSQLYSPQFIKLYGLTLSSPYAMIMEHAKFGALNDVLQEHKDKISMRALLDVVQGLVRGIVYLQEYGIIHGRIRCANLLVKKFDPKNQIVDVKIADPGFPRPYNRRDLPWIPLEYHSKDLNVAKDDSYAESWAFATTVWEIFAYGKSITNLSAEELLKNYQQLGGILPPPSDDCPEVIFNTIMDGWSMDLDKRFNHHKIFARVISVKETLSPNYHTVCDLDIDVDVPADELEDEDSSQDNNEFQNNGLSKICKEMPMVLRIKNGRVIRREMFGEGHYGTVYKGDLIYDDANLPHEKVAIKMLKSDKTSISNDFMREIKIMQALDHPNIVKIKEWLENPISIIMEYVEGGSFLVYLKSRKPDLTDDKLLRFALDIAKGMQYLCEKRVIHRDLAARNILVDHDRVKISDFGLAQMADSHGYYCSATERFIPVKWYSPESIRTGKFSFNSDVWSFGVTLFETFSRGETPNLDEGNFKDVPFLDRLERGERLSKPLLCPDIVYDKLMLPCWQAQPKMRPSFEQIIHELNSIIAESGEVI